MRLSWTALLCSLLVLCGIPVAATEVEECSSKSVDLIDADADDGPGILENVLTVDAEFFVNDVKVGVDISHTWIGDLEVSLTSPEATSNVLFDVGSDDESNDLLLQFTDSGVRFSSVESTCDCDVRPWSPMTAFRGESSSGDWTLTVRDAVSQEDEGTGTLSEWCVTVEGCEEELLAAPTCLTDYSAGTVTLTWDAPEDGADRINIYRNGEYLRSVETTETEFVDDDAGLRQTLYYTLGHENDDLECETLSRSCEVVVVVRGFCAYPDLEFTYIDPMDKDGEPATSTIVIEEEDADALSFSTWKWRWTSHIPLSTRSWCLQRTRRVPASPCTTIFWRIVTTCS